MFSATECVIESVMPTSLAFPNFQYRARSDSTNPVMAGFFVGGWLARKQGPSAIALGSLGFAAFSAAIEWYMHRETFDDE
jgi:import inner membrane translocase subunit TIM22